MSRPLILVGGGGHCMSVIDAALSAGFQIKGILDLLSKVGNVVCGVPVLGTDDDMAKYVNECDFIVTLGFIKDATLRIKLHDRVRAAGGHFSTVIASTAYVSQFAEIGEGTVILHHASVNAGAKIGVGVIINTATNIEHSAVVSDYAHVSTGVMVNGDCSVGAGTFIGSGTVMINGKSICADCVIGAGSVVCKDIKVPGIYNGNPAILKKKL
jgi:sugar O-acyltransferase (sialic acid O-acetyltransferase NeuD family)